MTKENLMTLKPGEKHPCTELMTGKRYRFCVEDSGTVFVFGKGMRTRGWRKSPDTFLRQYRVGKSRRKDQNQEWHKRLLRAIECMESSGLWPDVLQQFIAIINSGMTWDDRKALADVYWAHMDSRSGNPVFDRLMEQYPCAFYEDVTGCAHVDSFFASETSECILKRMYFGKLLNKDEKERIATALDHKQDYSSGRIHAGYDVTFTYESKKDKAWYSEEYRNCGNGHYYIALDANTALFVEND